MPFYIVWFILALILLFVEMSLMTFFLMAIAVGCIAGGIASWMGYDLVVQLSCAGIFTIAASFLSLYLRRKLKKVTDKGTNNLDQGQRVLVTPESMNKDGTARVNYRGAVWDAYKPNQVLKPGLYVIEKIDGANLVLGQLITSEDVEDVPKFKA